MTKVTQPGNEGPFVTPRSWSFIGRAAMAFDEFDKASKKVKKASARALLRRPKDRIKSKAMKKAIKKINKARKANGLPKIHWKVIELNHYTPEDLKGSLGPAEFTPPPWMVDEDKHSPSWHLDAYLVAREEYRAAVSKPNAIIAECDVLLAELDKAGTKINQLFGSEMVDGIWDKSEDYPEE